MREASSASHRDQQAFQRTLLGEGAWGTVGDPQGALGSLTSPWPAQCMETLPVCTPAGSLAVPYWNGRAQAMTPQRAQCWFFTQQHPHYPLYLSGFSFFHAELLANPAAELAGGRPRLLGE